MQAHSSWRVHRHRSRHKTLLRLVSPSWPPGEPVVLDHPAAAAYYLPGPSGCIVISSGAQSALTADELAAVLAHERAHARRRHHLALAPFRALSHALPTVRSPAPPPASNCCWRCVPTTTPSGTGARPR